MSTEEMAVSKISENLALMDLASVDQLGMHSLRSAIGAAIRAAQASWNQGKALFSSSQKNYIPI